jgi:hypothetical protein
MIILQLKLNNQNHTRKGTAEISKSSMEILGDYDQSIGTA